MEKHVIVFNRNQNYCIYVVELQQITSPNGEIYFELDNTKHSYNVMGRRYYQMPSALRYYRKIDSKYVFDSREDAQRAVDSLVVDRIRDELDTCQRTIDSTLKYMDKLKTITPKGKYRNLVAPPKVATKVKP